MSVVNVHCALCMFSVCNMQTGWQEIYMILVRFLTSDDYDFQQFELKICTLVILALANVLNNFIFFHAHLFLTCSFIQPQNTRAVPNIRFVLYSVRIVGRIVIHIQPNSSTISKPNTNNLVSKRAAVRKAVSAV